MPHVSGFEVLQQMSVALPNDTFVPVLVLTADATTVAKRRALAAGATELLHKPFDTTEVIMRIRNLLKIALSAPRSPKPEYAPRGKGAPNALAN